MTSLKPRYSKKEFARRGQAIYERDVRPHLTDSDHSKFVAIDIDTGIFAIDADDYTATERVLTRRPDAQIWLLRAGHRGTYRIGNRPACESA